MVDANVIVPLCFYSLKSKRTTQEYTEEFRDIAKGNKSKEALPAAPITLIHQRPVGEELPVCMSFVLNIFLFQFFSCPILEIQILCVERDS